MSSTEQLSWRDLESRFRKMQPEGHPGLYAIWNGIDRVWTFSTPNPSVFRQFTSTAELAAARASLTATFEAFLDLLREQPHTFEVTSTLTTRTGDDPQVSAEGGIIPRVCEAAADYCGRRANRELINELAAAPYEFTADFRLARNEIRKELRTLFQQDIDVVNRDLPEGHSQRNVRIEDACCGHLFHTAKKYQEELLEVAPLSPSRRSELLQYAIDEAFEQVRVIARKCGGYDAVEKYRDTLLGSEQAVAAASSDTFDPKISGKEVPALRAVQQSSEKPETLEHDQPEAHASHSKTLAKKVARKLVEAKNEAKKKLALEQEVEELRNAVRTLRPPTAAPQESMPTAMHAENIELLRKGDTALLGHKRAVNFNIAERYLGISERQRQKLIKNGSLVVEGKGHNRKITVESLKGYLPPENPNKPEQTRTESK